MTCNQEFAVEIYGAPLLVVGAEELNLAEKHGKLLEAVDSNLAGAIAYAKKQGWDG